MRILLKFVLDCDPDVAWDAIRSPSVLKDVSFPLASFTSLEHGGFPARFPEGDHLVAVRSFGIDVGRKVVSISYRRRKDGVRMMRDSGHAVSGPLSLITKWQHTLTVTPDGRRQDALPRPARVLGRPAHPAGLARHLDLLAVARHGAAPTRALLELVQIVTLDARMPR